MRNAIMVFLAYGEPGWLGWASDYMVIGLLEDLLIYEMVLTALLLTRWTREAKRRVRG